MTTAAFYDDFASQYHLIFGTDLTGVMREQAQALDAVIRPRWGDGRLSLLDVSCGVGTQCVGLAQRGYDVTASDLSEAAVARARNEAAAREVAINFSAADMRRAFDHHQRQFDVVLSADDALAYLLTDQDILTALHQMFLCCKPGGGCLLTLRDYEHEDQSRFQIRPYGLREEGGVRHFVFQVWEFEGDLYNLTLYVVSDDGHETPVAKVMRTRCYAVKASTLKSLMAEAGFEAIEKIDFAFRQPIFIGRRPTAS